MVICNTILRFHFCQVVDKSGKLGEFEDVSKVEKYEMGDDEYAKRSGKFRLKRNTFFVGLIKLLAITTKMRAFQRYTKN